MKLVEVLLKRLLHIPEGDVTRSTRLRWGDVSCLILKTLPRERLPCFLLTWECAATA